MPHPSLLFPLILLAAPALPDADGRAIDGVVVAQLSLRQRIIIRIPRLPERPPPVDPAGVVTWIEKRGPKCVPMEKLGGAMVTRSDSVDLMVDGGKRLRAKLGEECRALDFYSGFYIKPDPDGKVCAERDSIRSRSGGYCPIAAFKRLVPRR